MFPIQVSYFDGYTTKPTLIFCAWQLISESVSMRILTHLYALVHASTASCLYCNGAILWNRYKRQSPSLKLFRTLLKAIRNLDLRPKTKSYRFKNFGCRELTQNNRPWFDGQMELLSLSFQYILWRIKSEAVGKIAITT